MTAILPKAELHLHLEGALTPELVRTFAARNGLTLPDGLYDDQDRYLWSDFPEFLRSFDLASSVIRTKQDYSDLTYSYLSGQARDGVIYNELFCSPTHAHDCGLSFDDHLDAVVDGIDRAQREYGIVGRIIMTCVRHIGPDIAQKVARETVDCAHPYIVGFGMGGNESMLTQRDFYPAFKIAADGGLGCTTHAGEVEGPQSVWDAINDLPVTRIGHGVRAIEDPHLVDALAKRGIVLEVCPGSNIALSVFPDYPSHPLRKLYESGVKVTLGSDDPPFFFTKLSDEYNRARDVFGFSKNELQQITRTAIDAAFCDDETRTVLFARL
ncbi:adenosine deaminase [Thalassospira sp. MA62]|nr:adenosine deaminase [Thalassospira sp. MA62]